MKNKTRNKFADKCLSFEINIKINKKPKTNDDKDLLF